MDQLLKVVNLLIEQESYPLLMPLYQSSHLIRNHINLYREHFYSLCIGQIRRKIDECDIKYIASVIDISYELTNIVTFIAIKLPSGIRSSAKLDYEFPDMYHIITSLNKYILKPNAALTAGYLLRAISDKGISSRKFMDYFIRRLVTQDKLDILFGLRYKGIINDILRFVSWNSEYELQCLKVILSIIQVTLGYPSIDNHLLSLCSRDFQAQIINAIMTKPHYTSSCKADFDGDA